MFLLETDMQKRTKEYVNELGLDDKITLLGKILDRDYLRSLFARAVYFYFLLFMTMLPL